MILRSIPKRQYHYCSRGIRISKKFPAIVTTFLTFATASDSFQGFTTFPTTVPPFSTRLSSSSSSSFSMNNTASTTWSGDTEHRQRALERCIVPLSAASYKGSSGRVGVLGGSERYTGAPFYAAMASLKCGADLAFCFCAEEAAVPLKTYSPELMVAPVYKAAEFEAALLRERHNNVGNDYNDDEFDIDNETNELIDSMVEEVCSMMDKMHVLVLGPGLGRHPFVLEATARIILRAQSQYHLPLVIDADALFLLTLPEYTDLLSDESIVVLTPNAMELKRLRDSGLISLPDRCIVIEKGAVDSIQQGSASLQPQTETQTQTQMPAMMVCGETGGLKRSGGIGDVLAGTCGTLLAWNKILTDRGKANVDDIPLACWTACCFVKRSTKKAFDIHRRSMTAPDILQELGPTIDEMTTP